jgi:hypothetical protein
MTMTRAKDRASGAPVLTAPTMSRTVATAAAAARWQG